MHVPYFQRTGNHKVCIISTLYVNKTQRGKYIKTIFRQYCKISVEDDTIYKLTDQIKTEFKSQKQERKIPTLH